MIGIYVRSMEDEGSSCPPSHEGYLTIYLEPWGILIGCDSCVPRLVPGMTEGCEGNEAVHAQVSRVLRTYRQVITKKEAESQQKDRKTERERV